jgi:hypothetical protein
MSKPRHTTITSPRSSITDSPALRPVHELWDSELSMVLGGQSRPTPGQDLSDQAGEFVNSVFEAAEPLYAPVREGVGLIVATGNYVRWAAEHQESREISEQEGMRREAEEREWEEQKQREQEEERELLLQGDKPTTPAEVGQWLDVAYPEYQGELPSIPSHMVNPGPSHEPQIIIEPLDAYYY